MADKHEQMLRRVDRQWERRQRDRGKWYEDIGLGFALFGILVILMSVSLFVVGVIYLIK